MQAGRTCRVHIRICNGNIAVVLAYGDFKDFLPFCQKFLNDTRQANQCLTFFVFSIPTAGSSGSGSGSGSGGSFGSDSERSKCNY